MGIMWIMGKDRDDIGPKRVCLGAWIEIEEVLVGNIRHWGDPGNLV